MPSTRIIVAGDAGFLGTHVSEYFISAGYEVLGLDLKHGHDLADETFVRTWFSNNSADVLVNCFALNDHVVAGGQRESFLEISLEGFSEIININAVSLFSVSREFIRNNAHGRIINFSSIYSVISPRPDIYGGGEKHIAYGVSKAAVNQITRHLAVHSAPDFTINTIVLGGVLNNQNSDFIHEYSQNVPMKRMANPSDLYSTLEMLISPESSYITGSEIRIDGGWTAL
jgi:NAD(P)-dependent dehydrogenase (short-subunit alcohol dehydrogenase family)